MTPVDWINTTMVILMYRSYFSSSFDRKNIHKLSCEICLKISCTLIDIFCKEKNPDRKLMCQFQLMLNMNRFKDCWVTKESQSTLHIHVLQTTHSDFPFQIIIWCLIYTMPHLGLTRTGFLQMIQDLQFVFDSIAEVPGEFLVYNKRCSD